MLAKLEAAGLQTAPEADRDTFLRRVTFDLTGLPTTPEEMETFQNDAKPQAVEALVERLLASPAFGDRWGRHWLDVVRYVDSAGYEIDDVYPHAWRYRDYIIRAFNADKPYAQFVREQVAGDELFPSSLEARLATGMNTVGPYAFEGGIARPQVVEYQRLTDLANTVSSAFLGLTAECVCCHDHKHDSSSQKDYIGLQAIFAASEAADVPLSQGQMRVLIARKQVPEVRLLRRGDLETPGEVAVPALFRALPGGRELRETAPHRRLSALALWLTSMQNPLTARVMANRLWLGHFGKGLVRTPNDFGTQGEPPTHPALLDWLAVELFRAEGSPKHLHRLIVLSNTYRMSSHPPPASAARDPEHRLLSRFPHRRLEAEAVWDRLHAVGGTLNRRMAGPPVYPPLDGNRTRTKLNLKWDPTADRAEWIRRGVYLVVRRSLVLPFFRTFNVAIPVESVGEREDAVETGQALALLNGPVAVEQAQRFAARLLQECGSVWTRQVERAWLLAFGRPICPVEKRKALEFLAVPRIDSSSPRTIAVLELCQALLNANEFLHND